MQAIIDAINSRAVLEFQYPSSGTGVMERRVVEPHLLGEKTTGRLMLSAWQTAADDGETGWRNFSPQRIVGLRDTEATFQGARPGYNPNDRTMRRILARL
ncbi:MAG: WYL domain-containing protein [Litorimonas sp.]